MKQIWVGGSICYHSDPVETTSCLLIIKWLDSGGKPADVQRAMSLGWQDSANQDTLWGAFTIWPGITDEHVRSRNHLSKFYRNFRICKDAGAVAHNATFDVELYEYQAMSVMAYRKSTTSHIDTWGAKPLSRIQAAWLGAFNLSFQVSLTITTWPDTIQESNRTTLLLSSSEM